MKSQNILKNLLFSTTDKIQRKKETVQKKELYQYKNQNQQSKIKFQSSLHYDFSNEFLKFEKGNNKSCVNSQFIRKIIYDIRYLKQQNEKLQDQINKEIQKSTLYKKQFQKIAVRLKEYQNYPKSEQKLKIQQELIGSVQDLSEINLKQSENIQYLQVKNDNLESQNLLLMIQKMKKIDNQKIKPIDIEFEKNIKEDHKNSLQQEKRLRIKLQNEVKLLKQKINSIQKLHLQQIEKTTYLQNENLRLKQQISNLNQDISNQKDRVTKIRYLLNTNQEFFQRKSHTIVNQQQHSFHN